MSFLGSSPPNTSTVMARNVTPFEHSFNEAQRTLTNFATNPTATDFSTGIAHARQAIAHADARSQEWVDAMCLCTVLLWSQFMLDPSDPHLEQGLSLVYQTMGGVSDSAMPSPGFFLAASELHMHRFQRRQDPKDIQAALIFTDPDDKICETRVNMLADALYTRFKVNGSLEDLDRAIENRRKVLLMSSTSSRLRRTILGNLGLMLEKKFLTCPRLPVIEEAIQHIEQAMQTDVEIADDEAAMHTQLAKAFRTKYQYYHVVADIENAYDHINQAIAKTSASDSLMAHRINEKIAVLDAWSWETGREDLLDQAYNLTESNLQQTETIADTESYAIFACNFGNMCQKRYLRTGFGSHLESAMVYMEKSQSNISLESEFYADVLSTYSLVLFTAFKHRQADESELRHALELIDLAIHAEKRGAHYKATHTQLRGAILAHYAQISGRVEDWESAIAEEESALQNLSPTSPIFGDVLFTLSSFSLGLYRLKPTPNTIQAAIDYALRSVQTRTTLDHRRVTETFNLLSNAYFTRFENERAKSDVDESIRIGLRSIRDDEDPHQAEYLTNLASKLRSSAIRYERRDDIDNALHYIRRAEQYLEKAPRTQSLTSGTLTLILLDWCRLHDSAEYLDEAIRIEEQRLPTLPESNGWQSDSLIHLGSLFFQKFVKSDSQDQEHRETAIKYGRLAIAKCPSAYQNMGMFCERLGTWLMEGSREDELVHRREAKDVLHRALSTENSAPIFRVRSGRLASHLHIADSEWETAYECLAQVVSLFPHVSSRALKRIDQQFALSQLSGIGALAASCALKAGRPPGDALSVLESGRSIISSWHISTHNDVSSLQKSDHQELAQKYIDLRSQLARTANALDDTGRTSMAIPDDVNAPLDTSQVTRVEAHRNINVALQLVEEEIRSKEGFGNFQRPLRTEDFLAIAQKAPIVVINTTTLQSDAFLVTSDDIRVLKLSTTFAEIASKIEGIFGSNGVVTGDFDTRSEHNERLRNFLGWLWDRMVQDILRNLGLLSTSQTRPPRLYWVTNGLTSLLPLHAAGYYVENRMDNVPNYVESTYTTSFRALDFSRQKSGSRHTASEIAPLVIAMNETVGEVDLSGSVEAEEIKTALSASGAPHPLVKENPSKEEALEAMQNRRIVHLVCHGVADLQDPSSSRLLLRDAANPGTPDHLSVYDIIRLRLKNARVAYLSACSTAANVMTSLLDENIHIAATFQLIGFPHVIGTLWPVYDLTAVAVTAAFYKHLFASGADDSLEDDDAVAYAVHDAVRDVREAKIPGSRRRPREDVLAWAPFVHFGA